MSDKQRKRKEKSHQKKVCCHVADAWDFEILYAGSSTFTTGDTSTVSRTCKLLTQIKLVCQEIHDIKVYSSNTKNHSRPSSYRKNRAHPPNKCEKDGTDYTRSTGNKKHARCEDLYNSPHNQTHHALPVPLSPLPPSSPSLMSCHSSSEASSSEPSTSCNKPPSCSMGGIFGKTMALSSSQKETKESLEEQDSRGGELTCPDETSEWRSPNKVGIGDCQKSPKIGHWQHDEELEL